MKRLIVLLVLVSVSVWGANLAQRKISKNDKKVNKIIKQFQDNKVEVIVEGKVVNVEVLEEMLDGKTSIITKLTFETIKTYKENVKKEIYVYIKGGLYLKDGKMTLRYVTHQAHPLLEEGDHVLMGLRKYRDGYTHVFGKSLQIPYNNLLIDDIYKQKTENELDKLSYSNKNNNIDSDIIINKYEKESQENKNIIKKIKIKLEKKIIKEMEVIR